MAPDGIPMEGKASELVEIMIALSRVAVAAPIVIPPNVTVTMAPGASVPCDIVIMTEVADESNADPSTPPLILTIGMEPERKNSSG